MMKTILILLVSFLFSSKIYASFQIGLEGGLVWQLRNDLERPNNETATRLALDEIDQGPEPVYRVEGYYRASANHGFRFLYAPFTLEVSNTPNQDILYNDETFVAGQEVTYTYQFNSYRLTYFYAFLGQDATQFNVGFTAKIRDAETRLTQGGRSSFYDNVGFVPLLFIEYQTPVSANWLFHFNFDGLAGGPGRAFDFAFKLRRELGSLGQLGIGLRTLDGGADNEKVYSFAFFQYAVADWTISF